MRMSNVFIIMKTLGGEIEVSENITWKKKSNKNVMSWGLSTCISQAKRFHNFQWLSELGLGLNSAFKQTNNISGDRFYIHKYVYICMCVHISL